MNSRGAVENLLIIKGFNNKKFSEINIGWKCRIGSLSRAVKDGGDAGIRKFVIIKASDNPKFVIIKASDNPKITNLVRSTT
jgi:hypothetical protein